jgi:hypothetical protein
MSVRVFVSHSVRDDPAAKKIQTALVKALQTPQNKRRFTLLMDKTNLLPGDAWRAQINLWLGGCDVAVVLLSEGALQSSYVMYELSVLSYRKTEPGSTFKIIPVYIGKVDAKRLQKSRLDPTHLTEVQGLSEKDPDKLARRIVAELARCSPSPKRPIDRVVETIRTELDGIPSTVLDKAAAALDLDLPWKPDADRVGRFALRLLSVGMEAAMPALIELRQSLKNNPETMKLLVDLVASSWIDFKTLEQLPRVARLQSGRAVALNAADFKTPALYRIAASSGRDTWMFTHCSNVCVPKKGQTFAAALAEQVGQELRAYLQRAPADDLKKTLAALDMSKQVVLVAMLWAGLDEKVVQTLEAEHPHVTFFFLTGTTAGDIPINENLMQLIVPQLYEDDEQHLIAHYDNLHTAILLPLRVQGQR